MTGVGFFGRDRFVGQELRGTIGFTLDVVEADFGLLQFGPPTVELGLMPARVDDEQHVTLFDQLSGLETHLLDVTGDSRADFDRIDRLDPPGELLPFHDFFLVHRCHRDRGWRRVVLRGAPAAAGG